MKNVAKDPANRIQIQFTDSGDPYGPGSVCLSSFLGPLVREHVPVTLADWRCLGNDIKVALWEEIQVITILLTLWFTLNFNLLVLAFQIIGKIRIGGGMAKGCHL